LKKKAFDFFQVSKYNDPASMTREMCDPEAEERNGGRHVEGLLNTIGLNCGEMHIMYNLPF
jgi:hypothetical protein